MKIKSLLVGAALATSSSCATARRVSPSQTCLDAKEADALGAIAPILGMGSETVGPVKGETKLVQNGCWKRRYERRGVQFVLYRDPDDPTGPLKISYNVGQGSEACMERALRALDLRNVAVANNLAGEHRRLYRWQWSDVDVGPVKHLKCNAEPLEFLGSVSLMFHEMTHEVRQGSCLFRAIDQDRVCFRLDPKLPLRSLAKLDSFPTKRNEFVQVLTLIQHTYLTATDQPPLGLFDELVAYTVSCRVDTALLRLHGEMRDQSNQEMLVLPLFADYVALYLERLKATSPALYEREFGAGGANQVPLRRILDDAEVAHAEWAAALEAKGEPQFEFELALWADYAQRRQALGR